MAKIFIYGAGAFGTALAKVFENNEVLIYSIEKDVVDEINTKGTNNKYLPGIKLNCKATTDPSILRDYEAIIISVPSKAIRPVCAEIKKYYSNQYIISTSKGIEGGKVMTDIVKEIIGCRQDKVMALSGPSIAGEIAKGLPTIVMLAGSRLATLKMKSILETEKFFINITTDIQGVQYLGFYKNILAILMGLADGLDLGNNFKAALITKAYKDFYNLNTHKIRRHTFIGYAGLGDFYVTATSQDSRNRRFGDMLAKGMQPKDIKSKINQTVEGYDNLIQLKDDKNIFVDKNLVDTLNKIFENPSTEFIKESLIWYMRSLNIKTIIFDWGNVLTEGNYSMKVAGVLAKKYSLNQKELFKDLERNEKEVLLGHGSFLDFFKRIKKIYPAIKYDFFIKAYKDSVTYDKDMIEYCKNLKKDYSLYILSNNYSIIASILHKSEFSKIFDGMVFSNDIHMVKPHKDIFQYLLKKYKLHAETCLFVDDMKRNIRTAELARINAVHYTNINDLKKVFS